MARHRVNALLQRTQLCLCCPSAEALDLPSMLVAAAGPPVGITRHNRAAMPWQSPASHTAPPPQQELTRDSETRAGLRIACKFTEDGEVAWCPSGRLSRAWAAADPGSTCSVGQVMQLGPCASMTTAALTEPT